jgi:hypothetical protein
MEVEIMILGIQLIGILFGIFMLYYTYVHYKRKEFTVKEGGFWISMWVIFIVITLFPQIFDPIVKTLRLVRAMDLFVILGFMFLIGIIFYIYTLVRINQTRLDDMVRRLALKTAKKKKKK